MDEIMKVPNSENFITVVSVGSESPESIDSSGYVTVLTIGDDVKDVIEEVLVYRLPGERLGFGLKFEGGTKANEFVKRLFIQSCAPDSPASRVRSSWGKLVEGDEVLEIDSMPVNTMTRIDCVRCLKDSNVVIKLLVRHFQQSESRSVEDLPQVVSAEKKRVPPPPPPVPPRKIPKKSYNKNCNKENTTTNLYETNHPVPAVRQTVIGESNCKKFQSPRSSGRSSHSPDISRRDRRFPHGLSGPPDAEVYVDLFSQESTYSLSESDDTGSSISTVVDRFGSTTTSSLAGSLPSTPTSIQRHLDLSNLLSYDDDDFFIKQIKTRHDEKLHLLNEDGTPLQPPSCFQDAPLSYGNEDMRIKSNEIDSCELYDDTVINKTEERLCKKPPVPPRSRDIIKSDIHDENMNISNLPRLVDFVPKTNGMAGDQDIIKTFLENERHDIDKDSDESDLYSSKWSLSSQLATIGEVEEDISHESTRFPINATTPIVIVENADCDTTDNINLKIGVMKHEQDINGNMDTLSSDSRQPPDGHEFPDYVEINSEVPVVRQNCHSSYTQQLNILTTDDSPSTVKTCKSTECLNQNRSSFNDFSSVSIQNKPFSKINSISNSDLSSITNSKDDVTLRRPGVESTLHTRSQSMIDMSSISKHQKGDRWNQLAEQRKKGLSKLKGLVIPEHVSENEAAPGINIPEIISQSTFLVDTKAISNENRMNHHEVEPLTLPLTTPVWTLNSTIPKYSPAFKRKSLQIYPPCRNYKEESQTETQIVSITTNKNLHSSLKSIERPTLKSKTDNDDLRLDNLSDAPKSLESITSPTKSDCSFDYVSNSFQAKPLGKICKESPQLHKELRKSEDESDSDSAVSSSQSSYISRCSPPPSPTRTCETLDFESKQDSFHQRLLKPASVEAINRKNILASAKCRSGKDFKDGSLLIDRKRDDSAESDSSPLVHSLILHEPQLESVKHTVLTSDLRSSCEEPVRRTSSLSQNGTGTNRHNEKEINHLARLKPTEKSTKTKSSQIDPKDYVRNLKETKLVPKNNVKINHTVHKNAKSLSVTDLRKSFEKYGSKPPLLPQQSSAKEIKEKKTVEKLDISKKNRGKIPTKQKVEDFKKVETKKVEPDANKSIHHENSTNADASRRKIVLCPEFFGGSVGITLAGGTDYETKEVTIHKIRYGSVAYNDGQLKRGDKIISINGKSTAGLTHAESVEILKESVDKFVFIVEDNKEETVVSPHQRKSFILESASEPKSPALPVRNVTHIISLGKDGAGLGFSIEGGKDSPQGDLPLRVKKVFQGGPADKTKELLIGDELLAINDISLMNLSRIEAWSIMKKLPDGCVNIHIHR